VHTIPEVFGFNNPAEAAEALGIFVTPLMMAFTPATALLTTSFTV
jgi:hypothetical protein